MDKRARLDAYLDEHDLASVWFARPNAFAWLTGGNNVVDRETDVGVAAAGYDGDRVHIVTNNIEAPRLRAEELSADVEVHEFPWYETSLAEAVADRSSTPAAADFDVPRFETINASPLRMPLTEDDIDAYRALGAETAQAVEAVCRELQSGDSEREVASAIRIALGSRDIEAPVVLVGGSERAVKYRHYTPQDAELGNYVLVSVTAQRDGLHASLTRTVAFDPPEWLASNHHAAMRVETSALAATRRIAGVDGHASDVFAAIQDAYEGVGYPDEWQRHHQGGAAGYAGREWIATPTSEARVERPMAYAWNPTVQGAKSEDTVLVTEDGFEVLTRTEDWPTRPVTSVEGDVILERHAVLTR